MAALLIYAITEVKDEEKSAEYLAGLPPILEKFGGKGEIFRKPVVALSGQWQPKIFSTFRFDSIERIQEFLDSPDYAPLKKLRLESRVDDMIAIEVD